MGLYVKGLGGRWDVLGSEAVFEDAFDEHILVVEEEHCGGGGGCGWLPLRQCGRSM